MSYVMILLSYRYRLFGDDETPKQVVGDKRVRGQCIPCWADRDLCGVQPRGYTTGCDVVEVIGWRQKTLISGPIHRRIPVLEELHACRRHGAEPVSNGRRTHTFKITRYPVWWFVPRSKIYLVYLKHIFYRGWFVLPVDKKACDERWLSKFHARQRVCRFMRPSSSVVLFSYSYDIFTEISVRGLAPYTHRHIDHVLISMTMLTWLLKETFGSSKRVKDGLEKKKKKKNAVQNQKHLENITKSVTDRDSRSL